MDKLLQLSELLEKWNYDLSDITFQESVNLKIEIERQIEAAFKK